MPRESNRDLTGVWRAWGIRGDDAETGTRIADVVVPVMIIANEPTTSKRWFSAGWNQAGGGGFVELQMRAVVDTRVRSLFLNEAAGVPAARWTIRSRSSDLSTVLTGFAGREDPKNVISQTNTSVVLIPGPSPRLTIENMLREPFIVEAGRAVVIQANAPATTLEGGIVWEELE